MIEQSKFKQRERERENIESNRARERERERERETSCVLSPFQGPGYRKRTLKGEREREEGTLYSRASERGREKTITDSCNCGPGSINPGYVQKQEACNDNQIEFRAKV